MHFFQISLLFSEKFSDSAENVHNFNFSRKISRFSFAKISYDLLFLVIDHKFRFSPLFSNFSHIFSASVHLLFSPPTFTNFPLFSKNSRVFYILYVYFVSPILWPWCIYARGVNPGGLGVANPPPRYWAGGSWGVSGWSQGGRGRVVKYYYIL